MQKAQKIKVTVSTVEEQDGEDYAIKVKVKREKVGGKPIPLADSTIEYYATGAKTWLDEHRKRARANAGAGVVRTYEHISYVAAEKEPKGKDLKPIEPVVKEDNDMKLSELRAKYPDIKATSVEAFLQKVSESKASE